MLHHALKRLSIKINGLLSDFCASFLEETNCVFNGHAANHLQCDFRQAKLQLREEQIRSCVRCRLIRGHCRALVGVS